MSNDKLDAGLPENMSYLHTNIVTATQIYEDIEKGDLTSYNKRFGFGRENDYNEFVTSLEYRKMLPIIPYNYKLEDIYNISLSNDIINDICVSRYNDKKNDQRFNIEPEYEDEAILNAELTLSYSYSYDDSSKYNSRTNIDIIDKLTHQHLYKSKTFTLRTKFNDDKYISMNQITLFSNAYVSEKNIDQLKLNKTRRLGEILNLIKSDTLKSIRKESRPQIYYTSNGVRPDNTQYHTWNGVQVFDLDLKNSSVFQTLDKNKLKETLHSYLIQYKWYIGIGFSSSGNGLHIYTKVTRPHHYFYDEYRNEEYIKYWYRMSYTQKYAIIRYLLVDVCKVDNGLDKRHQVIDFAVCKISQGIRLSYDPNFLISEYFEDIQPCVDFHKPPVADLPIDKWLLHDSVINNKMFIMWNKQNDELYDVLVNGKAIQNTAEMFDDIECTAPESGKILPYKGDIFYQLRYNVCNTLGAFFGESGRSFAHDILKSHECRNVGEIDGMYNCSLSSSKQPSKYGLQILKQCGFTVNIGDKSKKILSNSIKTELTTLITKSSESLDTTTNKKITLNTNEYLGDYKDTLMNYISPGKANLIVSPPGTGKTELVKNISKTNNVLLVLPYISVIDAKVMKDNETGDTFDAYFGSTKIDDIKKGKSAVMTLDKFGRIDINKISYMYDYIMIDESHLIFTSSFRLEAMSNSLKNIKTLVELSKLDEYSAKVVMMTGTPTGEVTYFNFYNMLNHISINKNENRQKCAEFIICNDVSDMQAKIAIHIADSLKQGKKILYPTNAGDVQAAKLIGMIEYQLGRTPKWSYYKKANSNSEMATNINDNATVGDYELILASNYLSVGIDIKDIGEFECIYDSTFAGYEIEQFNCRLRSVDIHSKIYIPIHDNNGNVMQNLLNNTSFSIKMNREDRDVFRDYVDISKKKLELSISYDPITNRIFTPGFKIENGQIVFKLEEHELISFEERYLETMRTPFFISEQLRGYGYNISVTDSNDIDIELTKLLIKIGLENAKLESQLKNDLAIYTFKWLIDNDNYINSYGLEYNNLVNRIWKESIEVVENIETAEIIIEESILGEVVKITTPDRRIFDEQLSIASRFLSLYSPQTAKYIYSQCVRKSGKINKAEISRYMRLMQLVKMEDRGNIGAELNSLIMYMYSYLDKFLQDPTFIVSDEEHELRVDYCTQLYLNKLELDIRSSKMMKKYRAEVNELINVLCLKTKSEMGIKFDFRILPTPDNALRLKIKRYDSILKQMFDISDSRLPQDIVNDINTRHLPKSDIDSIDIIKQVRAGENELSDINPF